MSERSFVGAVIKKYIFRKIHPNLLFHSKARMMCCLCSSHLFSEVDPDVFTNNRITLSLVYNDPLRECVLLCGRDVYTTSEHLPRTSRDPTKKPSYTVEVTPFQDDAGAPLVTCWPAGMGLMSRKARTPETTASSRSLSIP